jgi:hypothetical protein
MRKSLKAAEGERMTFRARFVKTGKKVSFTGYSEETLLLQEVREVVSGKKVSDHVWFSYTKGFQALRLVPGCELEFDARVKEYTKGYVNRKAGIDQRTKDYKLSNPTKIKMI